MPRKKVDIQNDFIDGSIPMPVPHVVTPKKHEHHKDPYEVLPGDVPAKFSSQILSQEPKPNPTRADLATRDQLQLETKYKAARYYRYLDLLGEEGGNQAQALARTYECSLEEVHANFEELLSEVHAGRPHTDIGKMLERHDADLNARVRKLSEHMHSPVAAASIAAMKLLDEMADDTNTEGSFEQFLRAAKLAK